MRGETTGKIGGSAPWHAEGVEEKRTVWELEQRRLVTETLLDYCTYVDRNDPATLVAEVFAPDGRFELGSRHAVVGRENLARMFAKTLAAFRRTLKRRLTTSTTSGASTLTASKPAAAGRRRVHFRARSHAGVGRAWIGRPSMKRSRSSARSRALA